MQKQTNKKTKKLSAWSQIWRIVLAVAVPLGGGFLISLLTGNAMTKFGSFNQPPLAPPAWLFPVAWTILYLLMGLASFFIWRKGHTTPKLKKAANTALVLYGVQLVLNFAWTPLFFLLDWFWFAFAWLMVMWVLILILVVKTHKVCMVAFWMLIPYLLWCTFAAYLNCGIAILN